MNQWMAIIVLVITESSDLQNNVLIFALSYYIIILYHSIAPSGESTEGQVESVLEFWICLARLWNRDFFFFFWFSLKKKELDIRSCKTMYKMNLYQSRGYSMCALFFLFHSSCVTSDKLFCVTWCSNKPFKSDEPNSLNHRTWALPLNIVGLWGYFIIKYVPFVTVSHRQ